MTVKVKNHYYIAKAKIKFYSKSIFFVFFIIISFILPSFIHKINNNDSSNHNLNLTLANVIGTDNRVRITPTTSYPWTTIVKLHIAWEGYNTIATGALIDKNHVLTAAHCVYSHSHGGWADSIKIVPGEDNGNEPFGHAWSIKMRCYDDWIDCASPEHDFAVLTLDRDIGLYTGWMGLYLTLSSSSIYSGLLNTAGYPAELDNGKNLYWTTDYGYDANEYIHWYSLDTTAGQSGSPVWIYYDEWPYILSVVTSGINGSALNYGTRISQNKFYCINNWFAADETLTDKPDLVSEYNQLGGYNTTIVGAGLTGFDVWCKIRNLGTSSASSIEVSYYASKDTSFSKEDYLIGTDMISSLSPTASTGSHWDGTFPHGIPSGYYYVGWIIDVDNSIEEFNENNNYNFIWSSKLLVDGTPPINPTTCLQLNGTTESDVWQDSISDPSFNWSGATDSHTEVKGYYYYWGEDPDGTSPSFTNFPIYDPTAVDNGTYYLRICTEDIVGNTAPWKTLYVFKYEQKGDNTNDIPFDDPGDNPDDGNKDEPNDFIIEKINESLILEVAVIACIFCLLIFLFLKVYLKR